jgi:hypothetical protein
VPRQGRARWSAARARMRSNGRGLPGDDSEQRGRGLALRTVLTRRTRGPPVSGRARGMKWGEGRLPGGPRLSRSSSTSSLVHGRPCPTARRPAPGHVVCGQGGGGRKKWGVASSPRVKPTSLMARSSSAADDDDRRVTAMAKARAMARAC